MGEALRAEPLAAKAGMESDGESRKMKDERGRERGKGLLHLHLLDTQTEGRKGPVVRRRQGDKAKNVCIVLTTTHGCLLADESLPRISFELTWNSVLLNSV